MGIADEDVAAVRAASDIVGVVSQYTQLRRVGRRWTGLCPFHPEKSPSFSVNAEENLFYCLAGETRVLTYDGVKPIRELAGTTQRVLTERGRWVDAPFYSFGVQPLMKVTLTRNRQQKVIHATPEHRWLVRGKGTHRYERTTSELRPGHPLAWAFPRNATRLLGDLSPFGIAHGIVFGDGTLTKRSACLDLHGSRDAGLLKWFPLNRTSQFQRGSGAWYTKVWDLPRAFKDPPRLDESPQYLAGWLAGYLAADGHVDASGTCSIGSAEKSNLELVRDVCTRLGVGTYGITTQKRVGLGAEPTELHRVHLITEDLDERFFLIDQHRERFMAARKAWVRRGWVVKAVEPTDRREEVFCAVVDGTHNFTLEDNILTGNCFGCQESGDVITFVREIEKLDFVGAMEWLANKTGITLRYTDQQEGARRKRRSQLAEVMAKAVDWYHERLLSSPDAATARSYLRGRGIDGEVVREYRIGWAPDEWDALCKGLRLGEKAAEETGLGFKNSRGRLQDTFRARVLFPIFDPQGAPISFGGRLLPGYEDTHNKGKYKNTPETPLYQKSHVLYGMDRAKKTMVTTDTGVICEGYTDVIAFHRSGVASAVATCGTALTDDHVKVLRRHARRLVLAFDADGAGQAAAERFYRWEKEHDLEVAVADLPAGLDPADAAQDDPEALVRAVEGARPFLRFRLDRVFAAADLSTPEGRARTADAALALVAEHPDDLVRDQYVMDVAGRCHISESMLRDRLPQAVRKARADAAEARRRPTARKPAGPGAGGRAQAAPPSERRSPAGSSSSTSPGSGARSGPDTGPEPAAVVVEEIPPHPADTGDAGPPPPWEEEPGPPPGYGDNGGRTGWRTGDAKVVGSRGAPGAGPNRGARQDNNWSSGDRSSGNLVDGPAWEVLRHAVHTPDEVAAWLTPEIFGDPRHRAVFDTLVEAAVAGGDLHQAIEMAAASPNPERADHLRRLSVEEPVSEPFEAVRLLLFDVARRELADLRSVAASSDDTQVLSDSRDLNMWINGLRRADAAPDSAKALLAWLRRRVGDGG